MCLLQFQRLVLMCLIIHIHVVDYHSLGAVGHVGCAEVANVIHRILQVEPVPNDFMRISMSFASVVFFVMADYVVNSIRLKDNSYYSL